MCVSDDVMTPLLLVLNNGAGSLAGFYFWGGSLICSECSSLLQKYTSCRYLGEYFLEFSIYFFKCLYITFDAI